MHSPWSGNMIQPSPRQRIFMDKGACSHWPGRMQTYIQVGHITKETLT